VAILAVAVTLAGLGVRIAFLGNQSYWYDEAFSVRQAAGDLPHVFAVGNTEIHTPLYATLLWLWENVVGTTTLWTHVLSALFGVASVAVAYLCLRSAPISGTARSLAVALTAANGFGIVYAQESRPYALALLGATGLTAVTVTQMAPAYPVRARSTVIWFGWALVTATSHLLGTVLVAATAVLLALTSLTQRQWWQAAVRIGIATLAVVPQCAWILVGVGRHGFAAGTTWIPAPGVPDVRAVLTSTFSAGGLTPRPDGFAWVSAAGVAVAVLLLLIACASALPWWGGGSSAPDRAMGALLLGTAAVTLGGVYVVSQFVHVWTLRNMIVLVPALTWGVAWLIVGLPRHRLARQILAVAVLLATLAALLPMAHDLGRPYKTDFRGLVLYLARERAAEPSATFSFFGGGPRTMFIAADRSADPDPYLDRIYDRVDIHPPGPLAIAGLRRIPGPQVVVYYAGIGHPRPIGVEHVILRLLADPSCRSVPIYGLVVVRCP
jgi:hypothetical protein